MLGLPNQQNLDPMTKYFVNTQFPELSKKRNSFHRLARLIQAESLQQVSLTSAPVSQTS